MIASPLTVAISWFSAELPDCERVVKLESWITMKAMNRAATNPRKYGLTCRILVMAPMLGTPPSSKTRNLIFMLLANQTSVKYTAYFVLKPPRG
jgi:hypothetical protein